MADQPRARSEIDSLSLVGVQVKVDRFDALDAYRIRAAGFAFVRVGVWMDSLDESAWQASFDRTVAAASAANVRILLTVRSIRPLVPQGLLKPERDAELGAEGLSMARVIETLAARYRDHLVAIELWNEPDLAKYWPTGDIESTWLPYMAAACEALRIARLPVPLLGFGFSRAPAAGSLPDRLLQSIHSALPGCLAAVSWHAYGMTTQDIAIASADVRRRYGLPSAITEFGVPSTVSGGPAAQALRLEAFIDARRDMDPMLVSLYEWSDSSGASEVAEQSYGLVKASGVQKPALDAVTGALRRSAARER